MTNTYTTISSNKTLDLNIQKYIIKNLTSGIQIKLPLNIPNNYFIDFIINNSMKYPIKLSSSNCTIENSVSINLNSVLLIDDINYPIKCTLIFNSDTNNWELY